MSDYCTFHWSYLCTIHIPTCADSPRHCQYASFDGVGGHCRFPKPALAEFEASDIEVGHRQADAMTTVTFRPPSKPWSTNQDRNLHPHQRAQHIAVWKQATLVAWANSGHQPINAHAVVTVEIPFTQARKRDPHNYCGTVLKAIIDGLVKAGVWPDDTPEWVGHREPILTKGDLVRVVIDPTGGRTL